MVDDDGCRDNSNKKYSHYLERLLTIYINN